MPCGGWAVPPGRVSIRASLGVEVGGWVGAWGAHDAGEIVVGGGPAAGAGAEAVPEEIEEVPTEVPLRERERMLISEGEKGAFVRVSEKKGGREGGRKGEMGGMGGRDGGDHAYMLVRTGLQSACVRACECRCARNSCGVPASERASVRAHGCRGEQGCA